MFKTIFRLFKISSPYFYWMLLASFTGFLTIGSGIGLLMTSAYIISKAALQPSMAELQVSIVGVRFFGIFRGVFRYVERLVSHEVTFRLLANFRVWFFSALEPLAPVKMVYKKSGDILNRFVSDVEELKNIYLRVFAPPIIALMILALIWILFGIFNIIFSMIFIVFYLMAAFAVPFIAYQLTTAFGIKIVKIKAQLRSLAVESIQGMEELAIYDLRNLYTIKMENLNSKLNSLQHKVSTVNGLTESFIGLMMNGAVVSLLIFGTTLVNSGSLDGVYLSVIALGVMASFEALLPLPEAVLNLSKSIQSSARLFEIIDSKKEKNQKSRSLKSINDFDIEFKNVSFAYENENILENINLKIQQGKKIAIAGENGSGKSTLLNLLLGFWQTKQGKISIGDTNILDYEEELLRDQFSVMNQHFYLFNTTVKENLQFANDSADSKKIENALLKANIRDKFLKLKEGLDTSLLEHGSSLSGGERQRICLARTFLREAPILVFDEPSANLDIENEQAIFDSIFNFEKNKTVIIITHKLKYLKNADYIYFLHNRKIVEEGNFEELMQRNGLFKSAYEIQKQLIG